MNENTPSQRKEKIFSNNELKLNSLITPLEPNKHYDKLLTSKYNENFTKKYKTIAQPRKKNNIKSTTESIPKPQNLFINTFNSIIKTSTDPNNNKNKNDYKTKSLPKNRNNDIFENNENMLSKSSNNIKKINKKNRTSINFKVNENLADNENSDEDDSENLSKLAEDLLSISDEYNNVKLMRMTPINKKDFIGESKEIFNINNQVKHTNPIKGFNDFNHLNQNTNKNLEKISQKIDKIFDENLGGVESNLIKSNMNIINMENINQIPKLQTQLYISPIQKFYSKFPNNNYNNLDNNLNNESTYFNSNNISKPTKIDGRKFTKLKYHISSNSIINNNINNISNQINNYPMLNYTDLSNQIINNNYITNNKKFNKTALNQYNNNIWDISEEVIQNTVNVNSSNIKESPNLSSNKNINNNQLYNDNYLKNNPNSNRNNNSIGKKGNITNQSTIAIKKNIGNYSGYNYKTNLNYNKSNTTNNNNSNNNINNMNTFSHWNSIKKMILISIIQMR